MVRSNDARRFAVATAVGQNAPPPALPTLGVTTSDAPLSDATPFNCQPPAHGTGMGVPPPPPGGGVVPDSATVADPALLATGMDDDHVPACVGRNDTVTVTDCPGATVAPAAGAPVIVKGAAGAPTDDTVSA